MLIFFAACAAQPLVLVGPAGCDVSDSKGCKQPQTSALQEISLFAWPSPSSPMTQVAPPISTNGAPIWLRTEGRCLFASLGDKSEIVSYQRTGAAELSLRSRLASGGKAPVFVDSVNTVLIAANYHGPDNTTQPDGASVASFLIANDCSMTAADSVPVHGSSIVPSRQGTSHVHSTVFDDAAPELGQRRLFACDLGGDAIYTFDVSTSDGKLKQVQRLATTPGSGPRHLALHPTLRFAYVVHELGNYVAAFAIAADGSLTEMQRMGTLPAHHQGGLSKAAEIVVAPDGTSLFASNRGYGSNDTNSIASFRIAPNGTLALVETVDAGVRYPRGMELSPSGATLVVAGQSSGNIVTFAVEGAGRLRRLREAAAGLATPATLAFFPAW